jgi:hypothetical protein
MQHSAPAIINIHGKNASTFFGHHQNDSKCRFTFSNSRDPTDRRESQENSLLD